MQRRGSVSSVSSPTKRTTFSEEPTRVEPASDAGNDKKHSGLLARLNVAGWLKDVTKAEWDILLFSTCLKLLLFPA